MCASQAVTQPETPALVIDASGSDIFVGVLGPENQWLSQVHRQAAALEAIFPCVDNALSEAGVSLASLEGFFHCEGPGSVLGLRLCAMAIQTWTRLHPNSAKHHCYNSLQLTAALITLDHPELSDALLVSDWKKDTWNAVVIENGQAKPTSVVNSLELHDWQGVLFHLPQRKGWQKPPTGATTLSYQPERLTDALQLPGLLRATNAIELYSSGINTFHKWVPDRHRAPAN
jgi:tRNA threonylcarbamoyladenosine biosynthesis protein TsaB